MGLLYKLNTRTLQKFRLPPSLRWTCWAVQRVDSAGSEEARVFDCGMGVWKRVIRVELQCMSGGCVRNCSHFMRNLYPRWYYKQSSSHFFPLSTSFCLYLTHPHMLNLLCLCKKYDLTPRPLSMLRWKCRQMKMLCFFQPRITQSQLHAVWWAGFSLCLFRLHFTRWSWYYNLRILKKQAATFTPHIEEQLKDTYLDLRCNTSGLMGMQFIS